MKLYIFAAIIFIFEKSEDARCLTFLKEEEYDKNLQVETNNGFVQGFRRNMENGRDMFVYRRIPFAEPPLSNLRFKGPQEHANWSGVLDARQQTPSCVELMLRLSGITFQGSEDCLYLNVFSPIKPHSNEIVPVLFWIYGGLFVEGNTTVYDPEYLVSQNLVVVSANYRLGMFGFLSTEYDAAVGNYGLKDQNAVLKWIQINIKNFGGDPNKVTIMGQSAGASSVMHHMVSPKSKGLFHGAVAMSGTNIALWTFRRNPKKVAKDIAVHMGLSSENTTKFIDALRKMDSLSLSYGQIIPIIVNLIEVYQNGLAFAPTIEHNHKDAFITESSYAVLKSGRFNRVPLIIGTTTMEFNLIYEVISLIRPLLLFFDLSPSLIPTAMNITSLNQRRIVGNEIRNKYFKSQSILSGTDVELKQYLNDVFYTRPIHIVIQSISKYVPVYMYVFDYQGEAGLESMNAANFHLIKLEGVGHGEDLAYVWKMLISTEKDKLFSTRFTRIWSNFIKFGNPTPEVEEVLQNVTWPRIITPNQATYLYIGENLTVKQNYRSSYMQFWDRLCSQYCDESFSTY